MLPSPMTFTSEKLRFSTGGKAFPHASRDAGPPVTALALGGWRTASSVHRPDHDLKFPALNQTTVESAIPRTAASSAADICPADCCCCAQPIAATPPAQQAIMGGGRIPAPGFRGGGSARGRPGNVQRFDRGGNESRQIHLGGKAHACRRSG